MLFVENSSCVVESFYEVIGVVRANPLAVICYGYYQLCKLFLTLCLFYFDIEDVQMCYLTHLKIAANERIYWSGGYRSGCFCRCQPAVYCAQYE